MSKAGSSPKPHGGSLVLSQREIAWQRYALALELGQELLQRRIADLESDLLLLQLTKGEINVPNQR